MLRDILNIIRKTDLIIEVLDAREPEITRSRFIEKFVRKITRNYY
jgi:ribosome biogenesis GTPase A